MSKRDERSTTEEETREGEFSRSAPIDVDVEGELNAAIPEEHPGEEAQEGEESA